MLRLTTSLISLLFALPLVAAEAHFGRVLLDIPPAFKGPERAAQGTGAESIGYLAAASRPGVPGTVLQLTRYTLPSVPANVSEGELVSATKQYLLEMLGGIEKRRTGFERGELEAVPLGGIRGFRVTWRGMAEPGPTNGVMYCVITASDAIFFHVFGGGEEPSTAAKDAVRAVEALRWATPAT